MTLNHILEKLKSYSFFNKMTLCESATLIEYKRYKNKQFDNIMVYPHEIETFAVLSILSYPEIGNKDFNQANMKEFLEMINFIKNFIPTSYALEPKNIRDYISNTLINQLSIQQDFLINFYRCSFIFNFKNKKINMQELFTEKFNISYNEVFSLGIFLCICSIVYTKNLNVNQIETLKHLYPKAMEILIIDRIDYIDKQMELFHNNIDNCQMGFKLIFQYPFISFANNIYYPIPYSVKDACTNSLLYRLTEGDNNLRALIGASVK